MQKDAAAEDVALGEPMDASSAGEEGMDGNEPRPIDWHVENGVLEGRLDSIGGQIGLVQIGGLKTAFEVT